MAKKPQSRVSIYILAYWSFKLKELDKYYVPEEFSDPYQPFTSKSPKTLVDAKVWTLRVNETQSVVGNRLSTYV